MGSATEWITYLTSGVTEGCIYATVGLGFVLIARVTNIYNFAQGAYVMLGAMIYAGASQSGIAQIPAILIALAGTVIAALVQVWVTGAGSNAGGLNSSIISVGYVYLLQGFALLMWGYNSLSAPSQLSGVAFLGSAPVIEQDFVIWAVTIIALLLVGAGFRYTGLGRAMKATASNPTAARLAGISPKRMALLAFISAGLLGGILGVATAPVTLATYSAGLSIGLVGFIAAALGEFQKPVRVVIAGVGLGVVEAVLGGTVSTSYSTAILYAILLVWIVGRDLTDSPRRLRAWRDSRRIRRQLNMQSTGVAKTSSQMHYSSASDTVEDNKAKDAINRVARISRTLSVVVNNPWPALFLIVALVAPLIAEGAQLQGAITVALLGAIGATGLSLLMGLAGQLSLGQGVFYCISGYVFALLVSVHGWNVWLAILVAVLTVSAIGWLIGALTLRLRGVNLALVTLAVDLAVLSLVLNLQSLTGGVLGTSAIAHAKEIPLLEIGGFNLSAPRTFCYLCITVLAVCVVAARNLSRSAIGRMLTAAGADEAGAAAVRVGATRLRLIVFTISALMCGIGGALWAEFLHFATANSWDIGLSIQLIVYVVVGGLGTIYGGAVGAACVSALTYFALSHVQAGSNLGSAIVLFITGGMLVIFLRLWPGGIVAGLGGKTMGQAGNWFRARVGRTSPIVAVGATNESPLQVDSNPHGEQSITTMVEVRARQRTSGPRGSEKSDNFNSSDTPIMVVDNIVRKFGEISAVDGVSFELRRGEITALIGPNGAGKTTLLNILSGAIAPTSGRVLLGETKISGLHATDLAHLGVARTFQIPRIFGGLTETESVMVAIESARRPVVFRAMLRLPSILSQEKADRKRARQLLAAVGLHDYDRPLSELPAGEQRLAELARALAIDPLLVLLDEPAAGLNDEETVSLGSMLKDLCDSGVVVLLVEHDMNLVMSVSDTIIVLDQGRVIAKGTPEMVAVDKKVLEAYMGKAPEVLL
jgi:branched-chain amino acid transport system permease protein